MRKDDFYSYLDDFDEIVILVPNDKYKENTKYTLNGNDDIIDLKIDKIINIGDYQKIIAIFDAYLYLEMPYYVLSDNGLKSELKMGKISRSPLFDQLYFYRNNDLGIKYMEEGTIFKIWSPTAKKVTLELVSFNDEVSFVDMEYKHQGLWETIVYEDLEYYKYRYNVFLNGETKTTIDPYSLSLSPDFKYSYIVDKRKFYKMKYKSPIKNPKSLDYVINEISIRDFTSFFKDKEKSTYGYLVKEKLKNDFNEKAGFDYLKSLGVTHIQIMPIFAFGGVNELNHDELYNWGYNPIAPNSPSGYYSIDPTDPYSRINETKKMIDKLHKNGFMVVMDVVFNHGYIEEIIPYEVLCPGYPNIYDKDGMLTNYSGCKNDYNTSKEMIRKYIIDSIKYWMKEYRIDGFRFDLMGLIDYHTMNELYQELLSINPNVLVYGEGWKMIQDSQADNMAHMYNKKVVSDIGFFNDRFRENIRKYIINKYFDMDEVINVILGSSLNKYLFRYPHQSINYIECHDDYTLYDYLKLTDSSLEEDEIKKRALLGISILLLSLGIPFMHSGMEFYQSKNFKRDTFNLGDEYNMINWNLIHDNLEMIEFVKELIRIRKEEKIFRIDNVTDIKSRINITYSSLNTIFYHLKYDKELLIIFKNNNDEEEVNLSDYNILLSSLEYDTENGKIKGVGTLVLKRC